MENSFCVAGTHFFLMLFTLVSASSSPPALWQGTIWLLSFCSTLHLSALVSLLQDFKACHCPAPHVPDEDLYHLPFPKTQYWTREKNHFHLFLISILVNIQKTKNQGRWQTSGPEPVHLWKRLHLKTLYRGSTFLTKHLTTEAFTRKDTSSVLVKVNNLYWTEWKLQALMQGLSLVNLAPCLQFSHKCYSLPLFAFCPTWSRDVEEEWHRECDHLHTGSWSKKHQNQEHEPPLQRQLEHRTPCILHRF